DLLAARHRQDARLGRRRAGPPRRDGRRRARRRPLRRRERARRHRLHAHRFEASDIMTVIDAARAVTSRSRLDPALVASTIAAVLFLAAAAVPGVLAPYPPTALALDSALEAPSLAHPFGTDQIGRDLLSRVVFGTRESLLIG